MDLRGSCGFDRHRAGRLEWRGFGAFRTHPLSREPMIRIPLGAMAAGVVAAVFATAVQAQTPAPAGSADAAKMKNSMCIGCHGIPGYKTAFPEVYHVPLIAGQSPQYIVKALQAYRAGERSHPSMTGVAKSLSDQDMADLAAFYGGGAK